VKSHWPTRRSLLPLISVIIPVFNRASLIFNTIQSCLNQTINNLEVVLIDDCSSDDLETALRPFADDERVRLISHERNLGVSTARNNGVKAAKGEYVAFLDSDDSWRPAKLEKQLAYVQAQATSNVICGTLTEVRAGGSIQKVRPRRRKPDEVRLGDYLFVHKVQRSLPEVEWRGGPLMGGCFAQTSSFFLPKALALTTPFRTTLNQYEDLAFLVDLDQKGVSFLLVEEPLTLQDNDDRPGRLGARDDIERGKRFLDELGEALSDEARLAFEATHLAHLYARERPIHVLSLALKAFARGLIAPRSVLGILARSLLGQAAQKTVRDRLEAGRSSSQKQETA